MKVRLGRFTDPYGAGAEPFFELFEAEGSGNVFPSLTTIPLNRYYRYLDKWLTDEGGVVLLAISSSESYSTGEMELHFAKFDIEAKTVEEIYLGKFRGTDLDYYGEYPPFAFENKVYLSLKWHEIVEGFGTAFFSATRIVTLENDGTFSVSEELDLWSSQYDDEEAKASTFKNFRQQALAKNAPFALSYDPRYRFIGDPNNQSDYWDDKKWEAAVLITDHRLGSIVEAPSQIERYLSEGAWEETEAASLLGRTLFHLDREGEGESESGGVTSTLSVNTLNDDFSVDEPVVVATVNFYVNWDEVPDEEPWSLHNFMPGFSRPMVPPSPERTSVFCMGYKLDGDGFSHSFTFVDIGTGETLCMPAYLTDAYINNSHSRLDMIDLSAPSLSSIKKEYFFGSYIKTYELP